MSIRISSVVWIFVWCIFMGITVGSIGIGAIFPAVNRITKPFVCNQGQLELITQDYHPSPVETDTTLTWYCVDERSGARQEVSIFKMAIIAGPLYGLVLFFVVMEILWIRRNRYSEPSGRVSGVLRRTAAEPREANGQRPNVDAVFAPPRHGQTPEQRLAELKTLHDSGLIGEQDYAQKKSEILRDL